MGSLISLLITAVTLALIVGIGSRSPKALGNFLLILFSGLIAWSGGATVGAWGLGYLFLILFPIFILPILSLINQRIPWILTLTLGTLLFTGIVGLAVKITAYDHWKQFGNSDAAFTAMVWQVIGFVGGSTFGIALVVTLCGLGVCKLRQRGN